MGRQPRGEFDGAVAKEIGQAEGISVPEHIGMNHRKHCKVFLSWKNDFHRTQLKYLEVMKIFCGGKSLISQRCLPLGKCIHENIMSIKLISFPCFVFPIICVLALALFICERLARKIILKCNQS